MQAFDFHKSQQYFKALAKAVEEEGLVSKPPVIVASEKVCGFEGR